MIVNFFQSLERRGVEYLLISGQASVLYGAAVFSEDIDLWVKPVEANLRAFLDALRDSGARYHKLTPPLTEDFACRGHGFHFVVPDETDVFLDVMGVPPRVGLFEAARVGAVWMDSDWGNLPVISLLELIELKKTQRLEDYPIISRLALLFLSRHTGRIDDPLVDWVLDHLFTVEALSEFLNTSQIVWASYHGPHEDVLHTWRQELASPSGWTDSTERALTNWMQRRLAELQAADREYWKPVIRELKRLHQEGLLMPVGQNV